jgi:hypothetical protein
VIAVALAGLACASAPTQVTPPLSRRLPDALPSPAVVAQWERIDGEYETVAEHVRYSLFVDPVRPLLYTITQYRVSLREQGGERLGYAWETVIWNERPGERIPLRCFTEDRRRSWRRLWITPSSSWRDVSPDTQEFRNHMKRALEIYIRVHNAGRAGPAIG